MKSLSKLILFFIPIMMLFTHCAPTGEQSEEPADSSLTQGQNGVSPSPSQNTSNPLPTVSPSTPPSNTGGSNNTGSSGSGSGAVVTSFTIGDNIQLSCLQSGLTVQGHNYGKSGSPVPSCDTNSSQPISATVDVHAPTPQTLKLEKIKLNGVFTDETGFNPEVRRCTSGCGGISPHYVSDGTAYVQMLPKAVLTLLTGVVINFGVLTFQSSTISVGAGLTQVNNSYILAATQTNQLAHEYLKEELDGAKLEIFLGRHECGYTIVASLDPRTTAMDSCKAGEGTRVWNDRVFALTLKTKP